MKFLKNSILLCSLSMSGFSSESEEAFQGWMKGQMGTTNSPVVVNRSVEKSSRWELAGPFLGWTERRDYWSHYFFGGAVRYHFSENHGWEIVRLYRSYPDESRLASEIRTQTSFLLDAQKSLWQMSSSYLWTPIYGKYAWSDTSLVHFDIHTRVGLGVRFAERERQLFGEFGIGMSHFLSSSFAIVPELNFRGYRETRTAPVFVFESLFQLGVTWLL